jgi:uncharacterized protein (TIGR02996 family)
VTDRDALLAAIRAAPDDDAPRLVFADWLDENNEPHQALFIRTHVLIRRDRHNSAYISPKVYEVLQDTVDLFADVWTNTFVPPPTNYPTCGHPLGSVQMSADRWLRDMQHLFLWLGPHSDLSLHRVGGRLGELGQSPSFACMSRLTIRSAFRGERGLMEEDLREFFRSPYLFGLHSLSLSRQGLTGTEVLAMTCAQALVNIRQLNLSNNFIRSGGAQHIARNPRFVRMLDLDLRNNQISDHGILSILRSFPHLTRSSVEGNPVSIENLDALFPDRPRILDIDR